MSIHDLIQSAVNLAVKTLKGDRKLFFQTSENAEDRIAFEAITGGTDVMIDEIEPGQSRSEENTWLVTQATFESLRAFCGGNFKGAFVVRYTDRTRQIWKLLDEEPFTKLIDNNVFMRLNTMLWKVKSI